MVCRVERQPCSCPSSIPGSSSKEVLTPIRPALGTKRYWRRGCKAFLLPWVVTKHCVSAGQARVAMGVLAAFTTDCSRGPDTRATVAQVKGALLIVAAC